MVGGVGQAGSPVWVPGLAVCPVKAPWRETSAQQAFGKQRKHSASRDSIQRAVKRPETI